MNNWGPGNGQVAAGYCLMRVFQPDVLDLDDLAEIVRRMLEGGESSDCDSVNQDDADLLSVRPGVTDVVRAFLASE